MTKPLLIDCIKNKKKGPDLRQFNLLIENLSPDDKIGHWFIVDIYFNLKNASEKNLLFNETCTPIFEKKEMSRSFWTFGLSTHGYNVKKG